MAKKRIPLYMSEEEWDHIVKGLNLKSTTVNDYRKVINLMHRYENGKFRLQTITKEEADEYFTYLDQRQEEGTLSPNTVHRYQATLRSIGGFMESSRTFWPNYENPFSRLVRNETRSRTRYDYDTFANPKDIKQLLETLDKQEKQDAVIINFMANLGFSPVQIQQLQVSAFDRRIRNKEIPLTGDFDTGTFIEYTNKHQRKSPYRTGGYPVRYVRRSPSRTITWKYVGTYVFTKEYEETLINFYRNIGITKDSRKFFLTQRHLEFNYRAMHHMIIVACEKAGLDPSSITPYQLSLYGMVRSYLLTHTKELLDDLNVSIPNETNEDRLKELNYQKEVLENINKELHKLPVLGYWKDRFPIPYEIQVNAIVKQMGTNFLLEIVGIDPVHLPEVPIVFDTESKK